MKSQLKKIDLALKNGIWKLRIAFQNFKEKIREVLFKNSERDAKRIGQEIAIKKRVGIANLDVDVRNDDELIQDIKYQLRDRIHNRKSESHRLRYEIMKAKEQSSYRVRIEIEKNRIRNRIIKSDIEKLKSENKKFKLLTKANLLNQIQRENNQYQLDLRLIEDRFLEPSINNDLVNKEKEQLKLNHKQVITKLKEQMENASKIDSEPILAKIRSLELDRINNKTDLEAFVEKDKEELEKIIIQKEKRLSEIKQNPDSEGGPLIDTEEERDKPTLTKRYQKEDEREAILKYKETIKALEDNFRKINNDLRELEKTFDKEAKENKGAFIEKYVTEKTATLKKKLDSSTELKEQKSLKKLLSKTIYVETIEADHAYSLKIKEEKRQKTSELRKEQREIHQQIVQNNRNIRDIKDSIFYKQKAHVVEYYTQLYESKSDEEILKIVPRTKREQERITKVTDNIKNSSKAGLYLFPALFLLVIFTFYPIVNSFMVSFYKGYNIQTGEIDGFTLIGNYQTVLNHPNFIKAIINTGVIVFISVPITVIVGLLISVALYSIKPLKGFFQTVFFLPYVTNTIAIGLVFAYIFSGNTTTINAGTATGLANQFLKLFGASQIPWLSTGATYWSAMSVILIYSLWNGLAFKIIVFLAGIEGIDKQYYQASQIDGASKGKQFWRITVPLISPMILYILITSIIGAFKTYTSVVAIVGPEGVITSGADGPVYLKTIVFYVYDYISQAGLDGRMSLASSAAIILFAIILLFTAIQLAVSKRRVHY